MSNIRGRTTSSTSLNRLSTSKTTKDTNQNKNIKKKTLTKPAWDATNTDLDQHKSTAEEIERRKQICKSKNIDLIKFDKQKQEMLKNNKKDDSNSQLALLKEILYDDEQLKNIILKSDSTLKVVKDFFNEQSSNLNNINTKQAKINLTLAPNVTNLEESNLPYNKLKNDQKSTVITAKCNNLNNISDYDDEKRSEEEEETNNQDNNFNINIKDLEECLRNLIKNKSSITTNEHQTPPNQLKSSKKYTNSINDTDKVNRLKSSLFNNEAESNTNSDDISLFNSNLNLKQNQSVLSTMNDEFKRALIDLENKLNDFEKQIGKQKNADSLIKRSNLTQSKQVSYNSSYTLTLIQIVSSLLDYLKDAMVELNYEKLKQVETNKQLDIHRKLIDGLTTEVLTVKEQNSKIINEFSVQNAKIIAEMDQIKMYLKASISINQVQGVLPNTFIDTKPKIPAFTSQPQLNMENLIRPVAQIQQNQQSFLNNGLQQSTSFNYASLTDFKAQNNSLEETNKLDKFSERLNAMLQTDLPSNNLLKSTSVSNFPNLFYNSNNRQIQMGRPLSATSQSQSNLNDFNYEQEFLNKINQNNSNNRPTSALSQINTSNNQIKQLNYEFNSQIDDLKNKNIQVQQRLRQLQEEQGLNMIIKQEQQTSQLSNSDEIKQKNDALEKLKQEQLLLKEQINLLNKQRESTQQELEILSVASSSSSNKKNKNIIQNSLMKHLNEFNANYTIETNSPGLSPIQPENLNMEGGLNLEVTPTRNNGYKMK